MSPFLEILLTALAELLKNCPEPVEKKREWVRDPGPLQEVLLWVKSRSLGLKGADYRSARKEARELQSSCCDADIDNFIAMSSAA